MSAWRTRRSEPDAPEKAWASLPEPAPEPHVTPPEREGGDAVANIGKSITIRGEVTGEEDLVIEGRVEGRIALVNHHLTVGGNGRIEAEVVAKEVTIIGHVTGNVTATERAEIRESGRLDGDLASPRLVIQEGAQLNGSVTMKVPAAATAEPRAAAPAPARPSA